MPTFYVAGNCFDETEKLKYIVETTTAEISAMFADRFGESETK